MGKGRQTRRRQRKGRKEARYQAACAEADEEGATGPPSRWRGPLTARGVTLVFPLSEPVQSDGEGLTPGQARARLLEHALRDVDGEPSSTA